MRRGLSAGDELWVPALSRDGFRDRPSLNLKSMPMKPCDQFVNADAKRRMTIQEVRLEFQTGTLEGLSREVFRDRPPLTLKSMPRKATEPVKNW